jgi:hypothetical protein
MKLRLLVAVGGLALVFAGIAAGDDANRLSAKTSAFNPGHALVSDAASWVPGAGVPTKRANPGLVLIMSATVSFPPGASADTTIEPVKGLRLTSLGFDHMKGTYCTNGSPRWDIETANGGVYALGCSAGTHSTVGMPSGWERITFGNSNVQHLSGPAWPGFGTPGAKLTFLQVLQDEAGATVLDNLQVNGMIVRRANENGQKRHDQNGQNDNGKHH